MRSDCRPRFSPCALVLAGLLIPLISTRTLSAQGPVATALPEPPRARLAGPQITPPPQPQALAPPLAQSGERPYPINLPTALRLAEAQPLDIALASARLEIAAAQLERANRLWLPTLYLGGDYYRHDGQLQDVTGNVFGTSKSTLMVGAGPSMVFALSDALLEPLAARQVVQARSAGIQTAQNDSLLAVAEAYFGVQQARGELAGALETLRRGEDLRQRAEKLAAVVVARLEVARVGTELAQRRQLVHSARERWKTASAQLASILRLDPGIAVEPIEPPELAVTLINSNYTVDDLIPIALTYRPELATQQALVQATLERLRQERLRPLIPSILLRGTATNPAGNLSTAYFGGGTNARIGNFSWRNDVDLQVVWEFQNLGLGNRARVNERRAENQAAVLEFFRLEDRIAAEVAQALAQVESAAARRRDAEAGLKDAVFSAEKNFEGVSETAPRLDDKGKAITLLIRPQEAVAALQALGQAYANYFGAVGDYNRAQFRLYRALGSPQGSAAHAWPLSSGECAP